MTAEVMKYLKSKPTNQKKNQQQQQTEVCFFILPCLSLLYQVMVH